MRRAAVGLLLAVALLFPSPVAAYNTLYRCDAMVDAVNARRTAPDLRLRWLLCTVAEKRARALAAVGGGLWHDLRPVVAALGAAGVCWQAIGEVVALRTDSWIPGGFVRLWWDSPDHRSILNDWHYGQGGGYYAPSYTTPGRTYGVFYVLDLC